ncbi:MAG TPA: hypothetical protein VKA90_04995 [Beijerinckiaceae bacterium]|nr:hypothetical protein [Beijerinckiaceae bacterium]
MTRSLFPLALVALFLSGSAAIAQAPAISVAPTLDAIPQPAPPEAGVVSLSAVFAGEPKPIRSGLVWRVFEDKGDASQPAVVAKSTEAAPNLSLPPGAYIVHAGYGFASATKRLTVQGGSVTERLTISAGALKLGGAVADVPIPPNRISFSVFVPVGNNVEGRLLRGNVKAGEIIRLPEGMYHVVSTYGESNAIMRADLKVDTGRVTEATLNHRAATLTLKLVAAAGGEAFAGTAFSVLTPGGDVIREVIGAFPSVTLAEGDYTVIARQGEQVYTREFHVDSGLDRDVEVLATAK